MANRVSTWTNASGDSNAYRAINWSTDEPPSTAETLVMNSGVMNIKGGDLNGATLDVNGSSTVNLISATLTAKESGQVDFTIKGKSTLYLSSSSTGGNTVAIDVTAGSTLTTTDNIGLSIVNIGGGGKIQFIGNSSFTGGNATLGGNLSGNGRVTVEQFGSNHPGHMTVTGSVGKDLTLGVTSDGELVLDRPKEFHGTIDFQTGSVEFANITATSGELLNGFLILFDGSKVVEKVRFVSESSTGPGYQLLQSSHGVLLVRQEYSGVFQIPASGTPLPFHT